MYVLLQSKERGWCTLRLCATALCQAGCPHLLCHAIAHSPKVGAVKVALLAPLLAEQTLGLAFSSVALRTLVTHHHQVSGGCLLCSVLLTSRGWLPAVEESLVHIGSKTVLHGMQVATFGISAVTAMIGGYMGICWPWCPVLF